MAAHVAQLPSLTAREEKERDPPVLSSESVVEPGPLPPRAYSPAGLAYGESHRVSGKKGL